MTVAVGALGGAIVVLLFVSVLGGGGMTGTMGQMMSGSMMGGGLFGMLFRYKLYIGGMDHQVHPAFGCSSWRS